VGVVDAVDAVDAAVGLVLTVVSAAEIVGEDEKCDLVVEDDVVVTLTAVVVSMVKV